MSELRDLLRQANRLPAPDLWPDIEAWEPRGPGSSLGRRLAIAALALAVAGTGIALAATAFLGGERVQRPAASPVDPVVSARVPLGSFGAAVTLGEGSVWASVPQTDPSGECAGVVRRIDSDTNQITASIPVPGWADDMAFGGNALWVEGTACGGGNDSALFRIDPTSETVTDSLPFDWLLSDVAYGEGSVWLTGSRYLAEGGGVTGRLFRVDPATARVMAEIPISGDPRDVVAAEGRVWVLNITESPSLSGLELVRVDPFDNRVEDAFPDVLGVGVGDGVVWAPAWLTRDDSGILRFDAQSGDRLGEPIPGTFGGFAGDHGTLGTLVVGEGGVWGKATQNGGHRWDICRLNGQNLEVDACVTPDRRGAWIDAALDHERHVLWVIDNDRSVIRVDLRTAATLEPTGANVDATVAAQISVGQFPAAVAGEGAVWATSNNADPPEDWFAARIDPETNEAWGA
jgi:hypothetical protein